MNCKPGDLAVMVRSEAGNEGRIVQVVGAPKGPLPGDLAYPDGMQLWHCHSDSYVTDIYGLSSRDFAFPDAFLRPIRDSDGTDETLTWAGLPAKPEVTA